MIKPNGKAGQAFGKIVNYATDKEQTQISLKCICGNQLRMPKALAGLPSFFYCAAVQLWRVCARARVRVRLRLRLRLRLRAC